MVLGQLGRCRCPRRSTRRAGDTRRRGRRGADGWSNRPAWSRARYEVVVCVRGVLGRRRACECCRWWIGRRLGRQTAEKATLEPEDDGRRDAMSGVSLRSCFGVSASSGGRRFGAFEFDFVRADGRAPEGDERQQRPPPAPHTRRPTASDTDRTRQRQRQTHTRLVDRGRRPHTRACSRVVAWSPRSLLWRRSSSARRHRPPTPAAGSRYRRVMW